MSDRDRVIVWGVTSGAAGFALVFANLLASRLTRKAGPRAHWLVGWILNGLGMAAIGIGWMILVTLPPHLASASMNALGAATALAGGALYLVSASRVGRLRRPSRYRLELETNGVYAIVRHPQALALILVGVGLGGISGSIPFLLSLPLWISGWVAYAVVEEHLDLAPAFGSRYLEYRRRTPLLVPGLSALSAALRRRFAPRSESPAARAARAARE